MKGLGIRKQLNYLWIGGSKSQRSNCVVTSATTKNAIVKHLAMTIKKECLPTFVTGMYRMWQGKTINLKA